MTTQPAKTTELFEIGRWELGTETAPVYAHVVPAKQGEPGRVEIWALDTRVFTVTAEDDELTVLQHEPAPGNAPMSVRPVAPQEVELAVDLGLLLRLRSLPDAP